MEIRANDQFLLAQQGEVKVKVEFCVDSESSSWNGCDCRRYWLRKNLDLESNWRCFHDERTQETSEVRRWCENTVYLIGRCNP